MNAILEDLVRHKWWADAAMLRAIHANPAAANDEELRKRLHHMLFSNRYWIRLVTGKPFQREAEGRVPDTLAEVTGRFEQTQQEEAEWLAGATADDLDCALEAAALPGQKILVFEILMQIALHTQGHRAQCATRLRALGGTPPTLDFVIWSKERPEPEWPAHA